MSVPVCRGTNQRYVAQCRRAGAQKWESVHDTKSRRVAIERAGKAIEQGFKRARVLLTADYYDPVVIVEMKTV